ncbi:MAG: sensor domain-containing diguanylate cyclase [Rhodospirillales bacterium]|nr:sensor domain-containing diguanylate cyclase [Rhodospirillales bacterium]
MNIFETLTADIPLESFRALVVAGLFAYVTIVGRRTKQSANKGWSLLLSGFGLLLFASIIDVTDNFEQLNPLIIVGDTHEQAFLEKVVGYLGGFILVFAGFLRWLPLATENAQMREQHALEEGQQRYRDLVDLSPDAIILHRNSKIIYANTAAAELVGATQPDDLIGQSIKSFIHPDYQQQTQERLRVLEKNKIKRLPLVTLKVLTKIGDICDVEVASGITNFKGEIVIQSVLRDTSARMQAEKALKNSEHELRSIFDNMAEFYYRADLDGRIVRASGAALEVTGWSSEDIIDLKLADRYVDPEGREKFLTAMQESNGIVRNYEAQMIRRDGERIWVSTNARYFLDSNGAIAGVEGTTRDITETVQARDVLQHMAMHDVLTGLGNRRSFESRLKEALPRAKRAETNGAILYFDLDGFKAVNDTYGHDCGDNVLRMVGKRLKALARETDFVARIGGDEFCLIIEGAADVVAVERVAEKLISALTEPYEVAAHQITLGVSVGIILFDGNEGEDAVHTLITHADHAMYQAKTNGGNACCIAPSIPASRNDT